MMCPCFSNSSVLDAFCSKEVGDVRTRCQRRFNGEPVALTVFFLNILSLSFHSPCIVSCSQINSIVCQTIASPRSLPPGAYSLAAISNTHSVTSRDNTTVERRMGHNHVARVLAGHLRHLVRVLAAAFHVETPGCNPTTPAATQFHSPQRPRPINATRQVLRNVNGVIGAPP